MKDYYKLLGIQENASQAQIKKAFREKAKLLHPDSGVGDAEKMRALLTAYKTLSNESGRFDYDRLFTHFEKREKTQEFNYRDWLKDRESEPENAAKLIVYELLHFDEDAAIEVWTRQGALAFKLENYLERDDWMDFGFILAEELDNKGRAYEAFILLTRILADERKKPYFLHFTADLEKYIKEIVRLRLKKNIGTDDEKWFECLNLLLNLGFNAKDTKIWRGSLSKFLQDKGDTAGADLILQKQKKVKKNDKT